MKKFRIPFEKPEPSFFEFKDIILFSVKSDREGPLCRVILRYGDCLVYYREYPW